MQTTKLSITFTFDVENVDDRVNLDDWRWAISSMFNISDGRQPLVAEMSEDATNRMALQIAETAVSNMGHRRARVYPFLFRTGTYRFTEMLARPKIYFASYASALVSVNGVEFDTKDI